MTQGHGAWGTGRGQAGCPSPPVSRPSPLLLVCLVLAGCSTVPLALPLPARRALQAVATALHPTPSGLAHQYQDYVGVLHVHTDVSHDADGTFDDVVRTANAHAIDFVTITDHNTLHHLREGRQGWHGATLILVGSEISARGGHYLTLGITEEIDRERLTTQQVIDETARQGGLGFIAHPYFAKRRWADWSVTGFNGIEIYNVAHDTMDEHKLRLAVWALTSPQDLFFWSVLNRPYDPLRTWDELIARHGPLTGIGATDAHEFHALGITFAPYDVMFKFARTHLLVPDETLTAEGIYTALRQGHAYVAVELLDQAKGFTFTVEDHGRVVGVMGDMVPWSPDLRLRVHLPATALLTLVRDGQAVQTTIGDAWDLPLPAPGVYRVEAARHNKPWIFSNPIYVQTAPDDAPSPDAPPEPAATP